MTVLLQTLVQHLAEIAPLSLAESWDNVGLLVGDRQATIGTVMTCLTITPEVVAEAIQRHVDLVIAHHPLPFKPLARITSDTPTGQMLLQLIAARIAVYSAHTAFDSADGGINAMWAAMLQLTGTRPLQSIAGLGDESGGALGSGRCGRLPAALSLAALAELVAKSVTSSVAAPPVRIVGDGVAEISKVGIACGSGGGFIGAAKRAGCQSLVTGEATFHQCLEARAHDIGLVLVGHFHSERFAMERLADQLAKSWSGISVFSSLRDTEPLHIATSSNLKH